MGKSDMQAPAERRFIIRTTEMFVKSVGIVPRRTSVQKHLLMLNERNQELTIEIPDEKTGLLMASNINIARINSLRN